MLKFLHETEKTAKSVEEAIEAAMAELNVNDKEDVNIEIIDEGTKGFLGLGSKEAQIRVSLKDKNAALAKQFLSSIFKAMDLEVNIDAKSGEENTLNIDLSGDNMGVIIGKRGDTLDSLQYLSSLVVNQENEEYIKITLDTENYREKRVEALVSLAERLAKKVARTGKKYTLEPMNPYERRIIHSTLQDNPDVTTFSVGEDPYRKVVIALKNAPARKKFSNNTSSHTKPASNPAVVASYTEMYRNYKKTAQSHNTIKKAENFESYQSALEMEKSVSSDSEE